MPTVGAEPGELTRDINVMPLIDVLLVLIIMFMILLQGFIFIPAEIPPRASAMPPGRSDPQIVLDLRADRSFAINGQFIPPRQLDDQLHAIFDDRPVKLLFIRAADALSYQDMVSAMDRARGAGVEVIAWVPRGGSIAP